MKNDETTTWYDRYVQGMSTPKRSKRLNLVRDYDGIGDGKTLQTFNMLNALRDANEWNQLYPEKNGVELIVPYVESDDSKTNDDVVKEERNIYLMAPFNLTSKLTLTIERGVTLKATDDPSLWPIVPPLISYGQGRDHMGPRRVPFIGGIDLYDVTIRGPGTIDGNGFDWWKRHLEKTENVTRGRLIEFLYADGVLIEDILLINSPFWTVHPVYSSNIIARRLTIRNPNDAPNTDGTYI